MEKKALGGGPAFPVIGANGHVFSTGMSRRELIAVLAPEPAQAAVDAIVEQERAANPHGDVYKPRRRSVAEIRAGLRLAFADEMIAASKE